MDTQHPSEPHFHESPDTKQMVIKTLKKVSAAILGAFFGAIIAGIIFYQLTSLGETNEKLATQMIVVVALCSGIVSFLHAERALKWIGKVLQWF